MNAPHKNLIGEILCHYSFITRYQLEHALRIQKTGGRQLGRILLDLNYITQPQLDSAITYQNDFKKSAECCK